MHVVYFSFYFLLNIFMPFRSFFSDSFFQLQFFCYCSDMRNRYENDSITDASCKTKKDLMNKVRNLINCKRS